MQDVSELLTIREKLVKAKTLDDLCELSGMAMLLCQQIQTMLVLALTEIRPHGNGDYTKEETLKWNIKLRDRFVIERIAKNKTVLCLSDEEIDKLFEYLEIWKAWHHDFFKGFLTFKNEKDLANFIELNKDRINEDLTKLLDANSIASMLLIKANHLGECC